jgi:hypothetical protein
MPHVSVIKKRNDGNNKALTSLYVVLPLLSTFSQTAKGKKGTHQDTYDSLNSAHYVCTIY